jgi:membrane protease YdiL (CAAX protease family)
MQQSMTILSFLKDHQALIGLPILALLLAWLCKSGRLRRAFVLPPPVPNNLTGTHLLLILAAFFGVMPLVSVTFKALSLAPPAAATAPAETEPATSQPVPSPDQEAATLAAQAGGEIILLAVMLNLARATFAGGLAGFGLRTDRLGRNLFWAIAGYLAFWPICTAIAAGATEVLKVLAPQWKPPEHTVLVFLQEPGESFAWKVLPWVLAGLIAPFFEEVFFRGLLLSWLRKTSGSTWLAIVFTGAAFGIIHAPQWHLVPALASLGLLLGYLYARTGSLTLVILFHVVFNLRTLVLVAISGESGT